MFKFSYMKWFATLLAVSMISFAIFAPHAAAQDFTINRFHADIIINEDSSFSVEERIDVEFHRMKHGIYREIPFKYMDERGNTIKTPLRVLSVSDQNGKDREYRVRKKGNLINIRIGDPDKYVNGLHTYIITYKVENAILFFEDHDELYWNVTGNYWWAPIKAASAKVILAVKNRSENLWAACYTGSLGSKESSCDFETSSNIGEFSANKALNTREGFTIAFGWDKGIISPPSAWKKFLWTIDLKQNWIFFLPIFTLLFMVHLWRTQGRDPRVRESVSVMYEPPRYNNVPLTPAEVGTLVDEKIDPRDISSTIVGLALKGYIRIEETKTEGLILDSTDYYLAKIKEPDDSLSSFEKIIMARIFTGEFPGRMVSDMKNKFYIELELLKNTLYGELMSKGVFLRSPEKIRRLYIMSGIIIIVFCIIVFSLFFASTSVKGFLAAILTGLPVLAFSRFMPAKTRRGASLYMDVLGFQEFLNRAEKDRLERLKDKDLFSKFLPYAIALDVVDNWAKAFEGIYQEPPQWYVSREGISTFSPHNFSRSINSVTSSFSNAMFSAPRGSGISGRGGSFGGGGSSGGGFGGGGGGSW